MTRTTARLSRAAAGAALAAWVGAVALYAPAEAHKAVTSKYTFNEDIFPLFRDKCGRCHVDGGVAPMSLMTHEDASPWAESLRLEFLAEQTHPWRPLHLTARELDMMLVWANGGTPRGDVAHAPKPVTLVNDWGSGRPDLALPVAAPFTLAADLNEATETFELPTPKAAGQTVRAIDLLPGNPAVVRSAEFLLKQPDGTTTPLGSWFAGAEQAAPVSPPVLVPRGAVVVARITYRRTWKYERQELKDASTVGLYFGKTTRGAR